jgi:hypothetical protein
LQVFLNRKPLGAFPCYQGRKWEGPPSLRKFIKIGVTAQLFVGKFPKEPNREIFSTQTGNFEIDNREIVITPPFSPKLKRPRLRIDPPSSRQNPI